MQKFGLIILGFSVLFFSTAKAQENTGQNKLELSIPAVALLSIQNAQAAVPASNSTQTVFISPGDTTFSWLNYSSIVSAGCNNRIMVQISSGQLNENQSIRLTVGNCVGSGGGNTGVGINQVVLSDQPQEIVTAIGSCFTGVGVQNGRQLAYVWDSQVSENQSKSGLGSAVAITYTIVASN